MKRWLLVVALLAGGGAAAEGVDGWGRVSLGGGFRWVPNWWFEGRAAKAGTPVIPGANGGPQATASFGYGVTSLFELNIDLLGSFESIVLQLPDGARQEYLSAVYGAQLGVRLVFPVTKALLPYLSVQTGPLLSNISNAENPQLERLLLAFTAGGGLTWRITDRYGLSLDVRYTHARSAIWPISGINVGGVWFGLMFNIFFPPSAKRDLDVPGF